jgi:hypothetical protein
LGLGVGRAGAGFVRGGEELAGRCEAGFRSAEMEGGLPLPLAKMLFLKTG